MATTTTNTIDVELTYTDYTTRTYKLPLRYAPEYETVEQMKAALRNFNTAAQTDGSSIAQTFISENGAPVASINTATITQRTEEEIYSVG